MRISKSVMAVGGVVLAAALIGFTNPKTVHAVVAALVQVTNTASNPVVTQSVGAQADNLVQLSCTLFINPDSFGNLQKCSTPNDGNQYSVPLGQALLVTGADVTIFPSGNCPGPLQTGIERAGGSIPWFVNVPNTPVTTQFRYSPGMAVGEGAVTAFGAYFGVQVDCFSQVNLALYGYLTPAVAPALRLPSP